jgi:hypothetical protein
MRSTISGLALLCFAAAACSYQFGIEASFRGGVLTFSADKPGLFGRDPCVESLEIIVRDRSPGAPTPYRPVWRIEQAGGGKPVCASFPISYGQAPAGLRQSVAPEALKPGLDYEIVGGSGDMDGFGSFRISASNPRSIERTD